MTTARLSVIATLPRNDGAFRLAADQRANPALQPAHWYPPPQVRLLRILVVDDDCDMADSLTMMLQLWGHDVRSAYGGAVAFEMATAVCPDVLLLDLAMPKFNGCEVAQRFRRDAQFANTRIIAVSGFVDDAHQTLCRQAGFDDFLAKPLELGSLKTRLNAERGRMTSAAMSSMAAAANNEFGGRYTIVDAGLRSFGTPYSACEKNSGNRQHSVCPASCH